MSNTICTIEEALGVRWEQQIQANRAQAVWRLPFSKSFRMVQVHGQGKQIKTSEINELGEGFLAASFDGELLFMPADEVFSGEIPAIEKPIFQQHIQVAQEAKDHFIHWVEKSISAIEDGRFQKVVLSRTDEASFENFHLLEAFLKLSITYPNALVAAFYLPKERVIWMCATPEILVQQNAEGIFKTVSLAGTQSALDPTGKERLVQEASWTQKEIEEQAFVSRYIIECFKRIRLREYIENGPKTVLAGNLMHLKSEFIVDTKALGITDLAPTMLEMLHPTSAVCGMPKEAAKEWIEQAELRKREMYSGYLGPIGFDNETQLFVNLRTVRIEHNHATFFAGCGITGDSIPEKEWEETNMKCRTLKGVLMSS